MPQPHAPTIEWVKPPQQARSQRTLERILDAAEELILESGCDDFTVAHVARRARSSVGSLYARFESKEALVRSVFERFLTEAQATVESALEPSRWADIGLARILDSAIAFLVHVFHERRPLIAALTVRSAQDAEVAALTERLAVLISERLSRMIEQRSHELRHPIPERAVRFATWLALSAMEAHTLHDPRVCFVTRDEIIAELGYMCRSYLGLDFEPRQDSVRSTISDKNPAEPRAGQAPGPARRPAAS